MFGPPEPGAPGYVLIHWEAGGPQGVAQWVMLSRACAALWQLQQHQAGRTPPSEAVAPTQTTTTTPGGSLPPIRTAATTPTTPGGSTQHTHLLLNELEMVAWFVGMLGEADPTTLQEYLQEGMRVPVAGSTGATMDLLDVVQGALEVAAHIQPPPLSLIAALLNLTRACSAVVPGRAVQVALQGPLLSVGPAALFGRPLGRGQDAGVVQGWGAVLNAEQRVGEYVVTLACLSLLRAAALRNVLTDAPVCGGCRFGCWCGWVSVRTWHGCRYYTIHIFSHTCIQTTSSHTQYNTTQVYVRFVISHILSPLFSLPVRQRSTRWQLITQSLQFIRAILSTPDTPIGHTVGGGVWGSSAGGGEVSPSKVLVQLFENPDGLENGMLRALVPRAGVWGVVGGVLWVGWRG